MELAIGVARRSWLEISLRKTEKERKKEKEHTRKERKKKIQTTERNRRDQVTAANSWPSFHRKTGAEVDNQVAAPTELGTPTMHRAKIAQPRVRMEGWRQGRPGSNARNPQEGKRKQKEKNTLDSYRPSHGRSWPRAQKIRETFCNSDDFVASGDSGEMSRVIGRNTSGGTCNLPRD